MAGVKAGLSWDNERQTGPGVGTVVVSVLDIASRRCPGLAI